MDYKEITEAQAEAMADRMVFDRLERDRAYQNAENHEAQAQREREIKAAVCAEIKRKYEIVSTSVVRGGMIPGDYSRASDDD